MSEKLTLLSSLVPIKDHLETSRISQHYGSEGVKGALNLNRLSEKAITSRKVNEKFHSDHPEKNIGNRFYLSLVHS